LFTESAQALQRRPAWRLEIERNTTYRPITNDYKVNLPRGVFEPMMERIVRGLYWYEFGERLAADLPIRTYFLRDLHSMQDVFANMAVRQVGRGQVLYGFFRYAGRLSCSTWVIIFHRRLLAGALTDHLWLDEEVAKRRNAGPVMTTQDT
jgi:hypothetical protein